MLCCFVFAVIICVSVAGFVCCLTIIISYTVSFKDHHCWHSQISLLLFSRRLWQPLHMSPALCTPILGYSATWLEFAGIILTLTIARLLRRDHAYESPLWPNYFRVQVSHIYIIRLSQRWICSAARRSGSCPAKCVLIFKHLVDLVYRHHISNKVSVKYHRIRGFTLIDTHWWLLGATGAKRQQLSASPGVKPDIDAFNPPLSLNILRLVSFVWISY